ncbi:MAG: hypothetical protein AAGA48_32240 [Myxococcota bacterium]
MSRKLSAELLQAYVDLQNRLLNALDASVGNLPRPEERGAIEVDGEIWVWWRDGPGVTFEGAGVRARCGSDRRAIAPLFAGSSSTIPHG